MICEGAKKEFLSFFFIRLFKHFCSIGRFQNNLSLKSTVIVELIKCNRLKKIHKSNTKQTCLISRMFSSVSSQQLFKIKCIILFFVQDASKALGHRKNEGIFTPGNGSKPIFSITRSSFRLVQYVQYWPFYYGFYFFLQK